MSRRRLQLLIIALGAAGIAASTRAKPNDRLAGQTLTVVAVGDLMLGTTVSRLIRKYDPAYPLRPLKPLFTNADVAFGNLETTITDFARPDPVKRRKLAARSRALAQAKAMPDQPVKIPGMEYLFRAPTSTAVGLAQVGLDVVSLANNHAMDYQAEGMMDTIRRLRSAGVASVGAGKNLAEARQPVILMRHGLKIAFFGLSDILPSGHTATSTRAGIAPARGAAFQSHTQAALSDAKKRADFVAVAVHWGIERKTTASRRQQALGRQLIDWGADLVIGSHPHRVQPVEKYHGGLIHYSLGDCVTYVSRKRPTEAWRIVLTRGSLPTYERIPLLSDRGQAKIVGED